MVITLWSAVSIWLRNGPQANFSFQIKQQRRGIANVTKFNLNDAIHLVLAKFPSHRHRPFDLLTSQKHYNFTIMIMFKHSQGQHFVPSANPEANTIPGEETHSQAQESSPHSLPREKLQVALTHSPQVKAGKGGPRRKKNGFSVSLWRLEENIAYMDFLRTNEALFTASKIERKHKKVNILMSQYIKSRSPAQCRSHHQKMGKHHGDIEGIIRHVQKLMALVPRLQQEPVPSVSQEANIDKSMEIPEANLQKLEDKTSPIFDWGSWMHENQLLWEQKMNEEWMCVIGDSFDDV